MSSLIHRPISGRFSTTSSRLPIHIEVISPQNSGGLLVITCGPGWMLWIIIAATISAITGVVGMPSVSIGMNEVWAPALFADSGPATPSIAPLPKRSGVFEIFFSIAYEANDDRTAPPPGNTPSSEPRAVPRIAGMTEALNSAQLGSRRPTFFVNTSRCSRCSRFAMISPKPNMPIAITASSMPSDSSGISKLKRATPEFTSVPIIPSSSPSTTMASALRNDPCASTTAAIRPSTISAKYSAGPNLNAISESGGANAASRKVATVPAKNDPKAAIASAGPARPLRAIW